MNPTLKRLLDELDREIGDFVESIGLVRNETLQEELYERADLASAKLVSLRAWLIREAKR